MYSVIVVLVSNFLLLRSTIFAMESVICSFIAQHVSGIYHIIIIIIYYYANGHALFCFLK